MLPHSQIRHQEIANAFQDDVFPMHTLHRWVSIHNVTLRSLNAMLQSLVLLFQMPEAEYGEEGP